MGLVCHAGNGERVTKKVHAFSLEQLQISKVVKTLKMDHTVNSHLPKKVNKYKEKKSISQV